MVIQHVAVYESARQSVRYVYGVPVRFPFPSHFTDSEKLGTAQEQCKTLREAHSAARDAVIAAIEARAESRA